MMKIKLRENAFFIVLAVLAFLGFVLNYFFSEMPNFLYNLNSIKEMLATQKEIMNSISFWWAIYIFPDILIFLCAIAGGMFMQKNTSLWLFEFYRKKSYRKQLIQKIVSNSVKFSSALFVGFLLYIEFLNVLSQGSIVNKSFGGETFLTDYLSTTFIMHHVWLHELLFGVFCCLIAGFVYSFLAQCVALYFTDVKTYFSTWILVTFGYCFVLGSLTHVASFGKIAKLFLLSTPLHEECSTVGMLLAHLVPLFIGGTILFTRKKREVGGVAHSFSFAISFTRGEKRFGGRRLWQKYRAIFWSAVIMSSVNIYQKILYDMDFASSMYGRLEVIWFLFLVTFLMLSYRNAGMIQYEFAFYANKKRFFVQKMKDYAMKWAFFFLLYGVVNFFICVLFVDTEGLLETSLREMQEGNLSVLLVHSLVFFVFFNLLYLFVLSGILKKNYAILPYLLCMVFWKTERIYVFLISDLAFPKKFIFKYFNPLGCNYFHYDLEAAYPILSINWLPYLLMVVCYTSLGIFVIWYRNRKLEVN